MIGLTSASSSIDAGETATNFLVSLDKPYGTERCTTYLWDQELTPISDAYVFYSNASQDITIPEHLTASAITDVSANLSWSQVSGAQGYSISYTPNGGNETVISCGSISLTGIEGLTPHTEYSVKIRALGLDEEVSEWNVPISFTTLYSAPTGLEVETTVNSASLSWDPLSGAESYDILIADSRDSFATERVLTFSAVTSAAISDLTPNTVYMFKVRAWLNDEASAWSEMVYALTETDEIDTTPITKTITKAIKSP